MIYEKVEIKSEADLPKGYRAIYFVGVKDSSKPQDIYEWFDYKNPVMADHQAEYWINTFDWYLQPTEIKFPSEEEINTQANDYANDHFEGPCRYASYISYRRAMNDLINWIKKENGYEIKDNKRTD